MWVWNTKCEVWSMKCHKPNVNWENGNAKCWNVNFRWNSKVKLHQCNHISHIPRPRQGVSQPLPLFSLTLGYTWKVQVFLAWFFAVSLGFFSHFYPYGNRAWACDNFGSGNYTLDCLNFVQGLHSFVVSKCRKRYLKGTYLKFLPSKPGTPLEAHSFSACGSGYAAPKASLF